MFIAISVRLRALVVIEVVVGVVNSAKGIILK
jgi:hypothetical protein